MKRIFYMLILILFAKFAVAQDSIRISFEHFANGKPLVLNDSIYSNTRGEKYSVSKLKYYVSNIHLVTDEKKDNSSNVFLINASTNSFITIPKFSNKVKGVEFLLGVDSILNFSGAQDGALDPLNDMFWTWNSGYINFKLEGHSTSSKADLQRIEHHIGGYKDEYKTMRKIYVPLNYDYLSPLKMIVIGMNLDRYWQVPDEISISENPVIALPGALAVKAADHFPSMFFLSSTCCFLQ